MKKVLLGMFVALMSVFMVSCSNGGGIEKAKEILNELKADGANLDMDGLKAKLMDFAAAIKPEMAKVQEMVKKVQEDPSKASELMGDLEKLDKDIEPLMSDFEKVMDELPLGKELDEDETFHKEFQKALGMMEE